MLLTCYVLNLMSHIHVATPLQGGGEGEAHRAKRHKQQEEEEGEQDQEQAEEDAEEEVRTSRQQETACCTACVQGLASWRRCAFEPPPVH